MEWNPAYQFNAPTEATFDKAFAYKCGRNSIVNNSISMKECRDCAAELICDSVTIQYLKNFNLDLKLFKGEKIFDPLYFSKCN